MNSSEIINKIIEANHKAIGGKATRKQYPVGKAQSEQLQALGILKAFLNAPFDTIGFSDAKAVLTAAEDAGGQVGGWTEDLEGDVTTVAGSELQQALQTEDVTLVNEYEIEVYEATNGDMATIATTLTQNGIINSLQDERLWVEPENVGPAVEIINGLGLTTDEDAS